LPTRTSGIGETIRIDCRILIDCMGRALPASHT
jgi:hypothetical protein